MSSQSMKLLSCRAGPASLALAGCLTLAPLPAQSLTSPGGYAATAIGKLARPKKGWTGLDVLPGGLLCSFDGQSLVTLDPASAAIKSTLATLPSPLFGADVIVGPTGRTVFLGESSAGGIYKLNLPTKQLARIATLGGNFAFAFHPLEGERFLYVSAQPGFQGPAKVFRIDTQSGAKDLIAEAAGFAGPILFDSRGDLFFAPAPLQFNQRGLGRILRWSRDLVLSAIGPKSLKEAQASVFARGFDNAFDLARDGEGTFYATDITKNTSSLLEIGGQTRFAANVVQDPGMTPTNLLFVPGASPFERYGRAGSRFYLFSTDFAATTRLLRLTARRPALSQFPGGKPRGGTKVAYLLSGAHPGTFGIWLLGVGLEPERPLFPLGARGLLFPSFGVVLTAPFLLTSGRVDIAGRSRLDLTTPRQSGIRWTVQLLSGPVPGLPGGAPPSPWVTSDFVRTETQ